MKFILDTHAFLWWITDDPQLSPRARDLIGNADNELFLSVADTLHSFPKQDLIPWAFFVL